MIEKLPFTEIHTGGKDMVDLVEFRPVAPYEMQHKINELCDAVNEIMTWRFETDEDSDWYDDPKHREQPADPYAEQRKCICKLCWFWNDDKADKVIGILTGVFDEADRPFERNINQTLYKHCEPVKPDDDIIYKGGDNE